MLLSIRHRFLFIHTAKTGGTSVRAAFRGHRWRDPYRLPQFLCSRISGLAGHRLGVKFPRHAKAIAAQEMLPRAFYDSLFKFVFVRNPWDLQVSSFYHLKRERPQLVGDRDFEAFLRWKLDPERPYQYHIDTSIERQSDYVVDLHGKVIVDFIGRYERLTEDFSEACRQIGIRTPELPHRRRAQDRERDYRSYYTDETAALVAVHFADDLNLFDYQY